MAPKEHISAMGGAHNRTRSSDESECAYLESLIWSDCERYHPDETVEDLKH